MLALRDAEQKIASYQWIDPNQISRNWAAFLQMWRSKVSDEMFTTLLRSPVLDAGCGLGCFVADLLNRGLDAYGIDLSLSRPSFRAHARRKNYHNPALYKRLLAQKADDLQFPDGFFQTVFDSDGPITYADSTESFKRILDGYLRILSLGGKILITSTEIILGKPHHFWVENNYHLIIDRRDLDMASKIKMASGRILDERTRAGQISTDTIYTRTKYDSSGGYHHDFGIGVITKIKQTA